MSSHYKMIEPPLVKGKAKIVLLRKAIRLSFIINAIKAYRSIPRAIKALMSVRNLLRKFWDQPELKKFVRVDRKYYWTYTGPHWPSKIQQQYLWDELNRIDPFMDRADGFRVLYYAITSSCPLDCQHCFEWDRLNKMPKVEVKEMIKQIKEFQKRGVAQVQLSGGEPLVRFNDLIKIVKQCHSESDIWVLTSGFGINKEKVERLKAAGLTGISFSLEYANAEQHDKFRGKAGIFEQVMLGAKLAYAAGLVVCFDLCANKDFITEENLLDYARLAKKHGASFINVIEPSPVGRYANQPVELGPDKQKMLEKFYYEMNYDQRYHDYPIVAYPNYQMRKLGCMGGKRVIYVDSSGTVNPCPMCQSKEQKKNERTLDELIANIRHQACEVFEPVEISE